MCALAENNLSSVLLYAVEVLPATKSDISMLNHVVDRAVFRTYRCASADDIKYVRSVVDLPCVSSYLSSRFRNFRRQFAERFSWSGVLLFSCVLFFLLLVLYQFCLKCIYCIVLFASAAPRALFL